MNKLKFSIICPTRKRVANLHRFIKSMETTKSGEFDIEYLFYVDDDDILTENFLRNINTIYPDLRVIYIYSSRIIFSEMFNGLAKISSGDILFMTGDDVIMRTKDWDKLAAEEYIKYNDGLVVISTQDGIQNEKIATHSFIGRPWIDTLGYLVPGIFPGDHADNWLTDVSRGIGRLVYKPDIFVEHMHPNVGKATLDMTYIEKFNKTFADNTPDRYNSSEIQNLIKSDIAKLKDYINGFKN